MIQKKPFQIQLLYKEKTIYETIIIYITKSDIFHLKRSKYFVDDVIRNFNKVLDTGCTRIFINGAVNDGTQISKLMKIFTTDNVYDDDLFPETSALKYRYKETEEGVNEMSEIIERLFREDLDKAKEEVRKECIKKIAQNMLNAGDSIDRISTLTGMNVSEILKLQKV